MTYQELQQQIDKQLPTSNLPYAIRLQGTFPYLITSDRSSGGHLVEGEFLDPVADVETLRDWQVMLPNNTAFEQATLE